MICLDGSCELTFEAMGLFSTDKPWSHPRIACPTQEIIAVTEGEIEMIEGGRILRAKAGEVLFLDANVEHAGHGEPSVGRTSFYWLHFFGGNPSLWQLPKKVVCPTEMLWEFRALMHDALTDRRLTETRLALLLLEFSRRGEQKNPLIYEVQEYLRLHADADCRVNELARVFGYSPDHLSRLYKKEFGYDLKAGIARVRIAWMQNKLLNTSDSLATIASSCGFDDDNAFVKFFRYHTGVTPTSFRKRFFRVRRNDR